MESSAFNIHHCMLNPALTKGERGESLDFYLGRGSELAKRVPERGKRGDISKSPSFLQVSWLRFSSLEKLLDLKENKRT